MNIKDPIPANELDRLLKLSGFNLDYSNLGNNFKSLSELAARVAGTSISLINVIDSYTQWTISAHGLEIELMPREESVCQYTIMEDRFFEVADLSKDLRFKDQWYVADVPNLKYYYGIPLKADGHNIGALCVLDENPKALTPEKVELLEIIAEEIINRLKAFKIIEGLKNQVHEITATRNKVVHDIRGPLGGIIGLAQIISEQGKDNKIDEVLEFINLIHKSGNSILDLADEILSAEWETRTPVPDNQLSLSSFKDKLEKLYIPQAKSKHIDFAIHTSHNTSMITFSKNKLLQIAGNLISNAIKFTPVKGIITVDLKLKLSEPHNILMIKVGDTGAGLNQQNINNILRGGSDSTIGTNGELGFGFGLELVKNLVEKLKGTFKISSEPGQGACFEVVLPQYN